MFPEQAPSDDRSCQNAVSDSAIKRLTGGLPGCSTATGGYWQARQPVPLRMVSTLARADQALVTRIVLAVVVSLVRFGVGRWLVGATEASEQWWIEILHSGTPVTRFCCIRMTCVNTIWS